MPDLPVSAATTTGAMREPTASGRIAPGPSVWRTSSHMLLPSRRLVCLAPVVEGAVSHPIVPGHRAFRRVTALALAVNVLKSEIAASLHFPRILDVACDVSPTTIELVPTATSVPFRAAAVFTSVAKDGGNRLRSHTAKNEEFAGSLRGAAPPFGAFLRMPVPPVFRLREVFVLPVAPVAQNLLASSTARLIGKEFLSNGGSESILEPDDVGIEVSRDGVPELAVVTRNTGTSAPLVPVRGLLDDLPDGDRSDVEEALVVWQGSHSGPAQPEADRTW